MPPSDASTLHPDLTDQPSALAAEKTPGPLLRRTKNGLPSLVRVCVRLRPSHSGEGREVISVDDTQPIVRCTDPIERSAPATGYSRSASYQVDHAFSQQITTAEIYDEAVQRLVRAVVHEAKNASCFAYGATGSGKTYTMAGVMNHALRDLFEWAPSDAVIRASYFQVAALEGACQEAVFDLLDDRAEASCAAAGGNADSAP